MLFEIGTEHRQSIEKDIQIQVEDTLESKNEQSKYEQFLKKQLKQEFHEHYNSQMHIIQKKLKQQHKEKQLIKLITSKGSTNVPSPFSSNAQFSRSHISSQIEINLSKSIERASKIDIQFRQQKQNASNMILEKLQHHRKNCSQSVIMAQEMTIVEPEKIENDYQSPFVSTLKKIQMQKRGSLTQNFSPILNKTKNQPFKMTEFKVRGQIKPEPLISYSPEPETKKEFTEKKSLISKNNKIIKELIQKKAEKKTEKIEVVSEKKQSRNGGMRYTHKRFHETQVSDLKTSHNYDKDDLISYIKAKNPILAEDLQKIQKPDEIIKIQAETSDIFTLETKKSISPRRTKKIIPIPISSRRSQTQMKISIEQKQKLAEIDRIKQQFTANLKREKRMKELVDLRRQQAKERLSQRRSLLNSYSIISSEFVLTIAEAEKLKKIKEEQEKKQLEEIQKQKTDQIANLKQKLSFLFGTKQGHEVLQKQTKDVQESNHSKFMVSDEGKKMYAEKKRRQHERIRDIQFKHMIRGGQNLIDHFETRRRVTSVFQARDDIQEMIQLYKNMSVTNKFISPRQSFSFMGKSLMTPNISSSSDDESMASESMISKIEDPDADYLGENDRINALEYNGECLPADYLLAKFSLTKNHKKAYLAKKEQKKLKDDLRLNSDYMFAKADMFNESQGSFNRDLESEEPDYPIKVEEGLDHMVEEFVFKINFMQGVKDNNKVCTKQRTLMSETYQHFVKDALDHGHLPLPVLLKIKKGILFIPGSYTVTEGLAYAMRDSLKNIECINRFELNKAIFDQNNMNDRTFSYVLAGLKTRQEFVSLRSVCNDIGEQSAEQICNMMVKGSMPQLYELALINNKCTPNALDMIMTTLKSSNSVRSLTLSNQDLSERQTNILIDYLAQNTNIKQLDISWNKFGCHKVVEIFKALENNSSLQYLNLSQIKMNNYQIIAPHFDKFCKFIKENNQLTHLNLSSIALPDGLMPDLIHNIKRSISIHVVHLCGNRITAQATKQIDTRLKPKNCFTGAIMNSEKKKLIELINETVKKTYYKRHELIYDAVQLKDMDIEWLSVRKPYQREDYPNEKNEYFQAFILNKYLGHPEIHNSVNWKYSNQCWMCDKWRYTYIFWDSISGEQFQIENPLLEELLEERIYECSSKFKAYMESNPGANLEHAYITGSFTNWEPRRMLQIDELLAHIQKESHILDDFETRKQFANEIKYNWRQILNEHTPYKDVQMINLPSFGSNPPSLEFNRLFVYADFIKPGKHQYLVNYKSKIEQPRPPPPVIDPIALKKQKMMEYMGEKPNIVIEESPFIPKISYFGMISYHQFLGSAFLKDYNQNIKHTKFNLNDRKFDKSKSVFKDWRLDNPKKIEQNFLEEIKYWKVPNFVKNEDELKDIVTYMKKESVYLKSLFIVRSSLSYYPSIRWLSYSEFVTNLNINDAQFEMSAVDRIFIAVTKNMDKDLHGILPEKDMSRFQFYESLVRIAFFKYKQSGITNTIFDAVKKLVEENLKTTYDNHQWMQWREDFLWQLDIDDLYKSNLPQMNSLYRMFFIKKKTKTLYFEDVIQMFQQAELPMLPEIIGQCFGLSKMSIENDIKQRSKYLEVNFVEFLELFARVAEQMYKDSYLYKSCPLSTKIELLMDEVFPIIGVKRSNVKIELDYQSISEDEMIEEQYFI